MQNSFTNSHCLYFAYGSNMWQHQMLERCPSSEYIGNAMLRGFRLGFPITSLNHGGTGVASVLESIATDFVEGVVYKMSNEDLLQLDHYESLGKHYSREWKVLDIHKINGTILSGIKVAYYQAMADGTQHYPPSREYMECLIQGAKEHGLSKWYITKLQNIETAQPGKVD